MVGDDVDDHAVETMRLNRGLNNLMQSEAQVKKNLAQLTHGPVDDEYGRFR